MNDKKVRSHITKALDALDKNLIHLAIEETINAIGFLQDDVYVQKEGEEEDGS